MRLRCQICGEIQPVTVADEADEDVRTRDIRRTFRAEHVARCGAGSVSFELSPVEALTVDRAAWDRYVDHHPRPSDVVLGGDGFFARSILRDGEAYDVRVCEDCWQTIPRYVDFPYGLTSPESDGAGGAVPKWRPGRVDTEAPQRAAAIEHLLKAVCLPCYLAAFQRVYPEAAVPEFSDAVVGDGAPIAVPMTPEAEAIGRVSVSRYDPRT